MRSGPALMLAAGASISTASSFVSTDATGTLLERAFPNAPNGYTPATSNCPSTPPSLRSAATLSQNERDFLDRRRNVTIPAMRELLARIQIPDFDVDSYFSSHASNRSLLPNLGIAFSGGGWRALMNGAGGLAAFDNRTPNSTSAGHVGGLLQAATYLAGLSGGSWLVGSMYMNNFSTVSELQYSGDVWQFQNSILKGPPSKGVQLLNTVGYYQSLFDAAQGKKDAGFSTSLTDYWARAISYQLINATNGGPAFTWSSIALSDSFKDGNLPFPVIIANERSPGQTLIPSNTTVYEMTPYEFGTFDPTVFSFLPTQYLGTNFTSGSVSGTGECVLGFDNSGFLMGTSSSLFNQIILSALDTNSSTSSTADLPNFLREAISAIATDIGAGNDDIAEYRPNPFYRHNPTDMNGNAGAESLHLVDGGEDNQNIPLHPLIQPVRNVDVILAIDSSADTTTNWPNGSSLVKTYERSSPANAIANGTSFPSIPDTNTFINLGLNTRPTFFGCNSSNFTTTSSSNTNNPIPPLIIYLPSSAYTTFPNVSTFQFSYPQSQRNAIIKNGYEVVTMGNGTIDADWPICLACGVVSRSLDRINAAAASSRSSSDTSTTISVPEACTRCFQRYCWDGTRNETNPGVFQQTARLDGDLTAQKAQSGASALFASASASRHLITIVAIWGFIMIL